MQKKKKKKKEKEKKQLFLLTADIGLYICACVNIYL